MRVKNKPEPKDAKSLLQSVELSLRPIAHPVLGRRPVIKGQRVHAMDDERLFSGAAMSLIRMMGYKDPGYTSYVSFLTEAINQMPEEYRRLAVSLIISGHGMQLDTDREGAKVVNRVSKHPPLVSDSPQKGVPALWTPNQVRP